MAPVVSNPSHPAHALMRSLPKRRKLREIERLLGSTEGLRCLALGIGNGAISYMLSARGGRWTSADIDRQPMQAAKQLGLNDVHHISEAKTPFQADEFDRIVIVDMLEHVRSEDQFVGELHRIIRSGGELIVNVPLQRKGLLIALRKALGQTDQEHGHLRSGYTVRSLAETLGERFTIETSSTYSRFFSECLMAVVNAIQSRFEMSNGGARGQSSAMDRTKPRAQSLYFLLYPFAFLATVLDHLLFFDPGYMLISEARANK